MWLSAESKSEMSYVPTQNTAIAAKQCYVLISPLHHMTGEFFRADKQL